MQCQPRGRQVFVLWAYIRSVRKMREADCPPRRGKGAGSGGGERDLGGVGQSEKSSTDQASAKMAVARRDETASWLRALARRNGSAEQNSPVVGYRRASGTHVYSTRCPENRFVPSDQRISDHGYACIATCRTAGKRVWLDRDVHGTTVCVPGGNLVTEITPSHRDFPITGTPGPNSLDPPGP